LKFKGIEKIAIFLNIIYKIDILITGVSTNNNLQNNFPQYDANISGGTKFENSE